MGGLGFCLQKGHEELHAQPGERSDFSFVLDAKDWLHERGAERRLHGGLGAELEDALHGLHGPA